MTHNNHINRHNKQILNISNVGYLNLIWVEVHFADMNLEFTKTKSKNTKMFVWIFFQRNTDPKWNCLVCTKFLKNSPRIVFSWNSTQESPLNLE